MESSFDAIAFSVFLSSFLLCRSSLFTLESERAERLFLDLSSLSLSLLLLFSLVYLVNLLVSRHSPPSNHSLLHLLMSSRSSKRHRNSDSQRRLQEVLLSPAPPKTVLFGMNFLRWIMTGKLGEGMMGGEQYMDLFGILNVARI